jgi:demethylsterigmatocystin 6-O-methyltransferase
MSPLAESKNMSRVRADEAARLKMQDSLHAAAEAMETPNDTMLRLFNGVSTDRDWIQICSVLFG